MSTKIKCFGINFEGGKIIKHVLETKQCIAYANIQIAMDAPYHGRVADEKLRNKGRSELQFPKKYGYSDSLVQDKISQILKYIKENYPNIKVIMQIARGRSAINMYEEVLKPILQEYNLVSEDGNINPRKFKIVNGYRSKNYFKYSSTKSDFIFLNIGMFAVLTNVSKINVGQICNPIITYDVINTDLKFKGKHVFTDKKNILNTFSNIPKILLFGIDDTMPFITPDVYPKEKINKLLKSV